MAVPIAQKGTIYLGMEYVFYEDCLLLASAAYLFRCKGRSGKTDYECASSHPIGMPLPGNRAASLPFCSGTLSSLGSASALSAE